MIKMRSGNRIYGYPSFPAVCVREMEKRGVLFFFSVNWKKNSLLLAADMQRTLGTLDLKNIKLRQFYFLIFLSLLLLLFSKTLSSWSPLPTPPPKSQGGLTPQSMLHKQCETFIGYPKLMFKMLLGNMFGYSSFPALRVGYLKKRGTLYFLGIERIIHSHWKSTGWNFLLINSFASMLTKAQGEDH